MEKLIHGQTSGTHARTDAHREDEKAKSARIETLLHSSLLDTQGHRKKPALFTQTELIAYVAAVFLFFVGFFALITTFR